MEMKQMKGIELYICSGGVDDHFFTDRIAITVNKNLIHNLYYDWNQISGEVVCIDDFLALLISHGVIMEQGELCDMRDRCYIYKGNMFFCTRKNKTIEELFEFADSDLLQLFIFDIGGASINIDNKYKLVIHTDEDIHRNMPSYLGNVVRCISNIEMCTKMILDKDEIDLTNLKSYFTSHVVIERKQRKYTYKANFSVAAHMCRLFYLRKTTSPNLETIIARNIIPIRPDRYRERKLTVKVFHGFLYRVA